ncbi:TPA: YcaO-like family protein [Staphylococcus aureus]|nr:YcaO-like family protein [Staphylococcus aureus]HDE7973622.1 YcaO-like family protein [Staphylococcus aureus]HDE8178007.1 YcaO-like family protein [Staphylococcus aureus]HDE8718339.1 YcaO-like family protein [Staphylococcus aureus]HDE9051621.1 YcaO-like family protein [Staphylococcus aureus]
MKGFYVEKNLDFIVVKFFNKSFILKRREDANNYKSLIHRLLLNHNLIAYITENDIDIFEVKSSQCSTIEMILGEKISKLKHQSKVKEFVYVLNNKSKEINLKEYFLVPKFLELPNDRSEEYDEVIYELNNCVNKEFRERSIRQIYNIFEKQFLDKDIGIFNTLLDNFEGAFPVSVAMLPLNNGKEEPGVGRTQNILNSRTVAMLEAAERYCGISPKGKKTIRHFDNETYVNIEDLILHNNVFLLNNGIKNSNFPTYPQINDMKWIQSLEINTYKKVLIPESYGYYGLNVINPNAKVNYLAYEISNGCSIGNNYLEAIYYGLMEVLERDAFLSFWYFNTPKKRITNIDNKKTMEFINKFRTFYSDYELFLYDISNDNEIPVILASVVSTQETNSKMNFMCAAAADVNIFVAVEKAIHEISGILFGLNNKFLDRYNELCQMASRDLDIKTMEDHSLVYGLPDFRQLISEKFKTSDNISLSDEKLVTYSLKEALTLAKRNVFKNKKDVLFLDQTSTEVKEIGFRVGKVIVPGLLPMTFGQKNIRVNERRKEELEKYFNSSLNTDLSPHPFP